MRATIFALLLLAVTAQAGHHRGHAIEFLDSAEVALTNAEWKFYKAFEKAPRDFTPEQIETIRVIRVYTDSAKQDLSDARILISDPLVNNGTFGLSVNGKKCLNESTHISPALDCARRMITQPRPANVGRWGAYRRFFVIMGRLIYVRDWYTDQGWTDTIRAYQVFTRNVQQNLDFVNWHIQDAIREEVYADPNFQ